MPDDVTLVLALVRVELERLRECEGAIFGALTPMQRSRFQMLHNSHLNSLSRLHAAFVQPVLLELPHVHD